MIRIKTLCAAAALAGSVALTGCYDNGYYGGVSAGYGVADWDPYYGGYRGDPYWGWYGDYYYPGTGGYVYGRDNRRHRWNAGQRGYWQGRSQHWSADHREMRPMWRDYGVAGGNRWSGRGGRHR